MFLKTLVRKGLAFVGTLCFSVIAFADKTVNTLQMNMTEGVTPMSREIYFLHMTIFWICVAIAVVVFGVMFYAIIYHRKSRGHKAAKFHSSLSVEILWAVIPFLILVVMAVPATIVLIRMEDESKADVNIKVTGYQWKWKYEYLDQGISFFSVLATPQDQILGKAPRGKWYLLEVDKHLVIPIHKKIRFLVTSNDVIHSWWVPALGVKRDAMPGFIHESWARVEKPGIYRGQCAELCGLNHGYMPIVVEAKTEADFDKWVAEQTKSTGPLSETPPRVMAKDELMTKGKQVYETTCAVCHKADGTGTPPAFPAMVGSKISTGPIAAHINIVLNGKTGTAMQAFKDQLTEEQIAAVITYERNAWGNDDQQKFGKEAGGLIQPLDIVKAKGGKIPTAVTTPVVPSPEKQIASPVPGSERPAQPTQPVNAPAEKTVPATIPAKPSPTVAPTTPQAATQTPAVTPATPTAAPPEFLAEGKKFYESTCAVCHKPDGSGMPPAFPALAGSKIAVGPMAAHIDIVMNGKHGTAMMAFKNQLSDEQIAAIISYERNSWGNDNQQQFGKDAGGFVQPSDITKVRNAPAKN